jgi:hypothetical protein
MILVWLVKFFEGPGSSLKFPLVGVERGNSWEGKYCHWSVGLWSRVKSILDLRGVVKVQDPPCLGLMGLEIGMKMRGVHLCFKVAWVGVIRSMRE